MDIIDICTLPDLTAHLRSFLVDLDDGAALTPLEGALIELGVRASVTTLDRELIVTAIGRAFSLHATVDQVQEVVTLVSGLGVHSLMVTAPLIVASARAKGLMDQAPLDARRTELWNHHVGDQSYWGRFDQAAPGFLDALLRLSPDVFEGFFAYCALPLRTRSLDPRVSELIALATDATPSHVFPMGAVLHLDNAIKLGAGRHAVEQALAIAASCPAPATKDRDGHLPSP